MVQRNDNRNVSVAGSTDTLVVEDADFTIKNDDDQTKAIRFELGDNTTGQTRVIKPPNANTTLVGRDTTDTLSNKTLTTPAITTPTVTGDVDVNTGKVSIEGTSAGVLAAGGEFYDHVMVAVGYLGNPLTNAHQVGVYSAVKGNSNVASPADGFVCGFETALGTAAGAFTLARLVHLALGSVTKGAGTTIDRTIGLMFVDETAGTANAFIAKDGSNFSGNWFIYYDGTRATHLGGNLEVSGDLTFSGATEIQNDATDQYIRLRGGTSGSAGANLLLFGPTHATNSNKADLNGTGGITLTGGDITIGGTGEMYRSSNVGYQRIRGGTSGNGATLLLFGGAHATNANQADITASGGITLQGALTCTSTVKVQNGATIRSGTGTPEAAVTGSVGDLFLRTDGGAGTTLYVKESGAGTNTGWVAK